MHQYLYHVNPLKRDILVVDGSADATGSVSPRHRSSRLLRRGLRGLRRGLDWLRLHGCEPTGCGMYALCTGAAAGCCGAVCGAYCCWEGIGAGWDATGAAGAL